MPKGFAVAAKGLDMVSQHGAMTARSSQIVSRRGKNASHRNEEAVLQSGTPSLNQTMFMAKSDNGVSKLNNG